MKLDLYPPALDRDEQVGLEVTSTRYSTAGGVRIRATDDDARSGIEPAPRVREANTDGRALVSCAG